MNAKNARKKRDQDAMWEARKKEMGATPMKAKAYGHGVEFYLDHFFVGSCIYSLFSLNRVDKEVKWIALEMVRRWNACIPTEQLDPAPPSNEVEIGRALVSAVTGQKPERITAKVRRKSSKP